MKPANLLFKSTPFNGIILKIADYGLARKDDKLMKSYVGTTMYEAPEIYRRENYISKCDLYSVGVILYEMATKTLPFSYDTNHFENCMRDRVKVSIPEDMNIHPDLADLLIHLITHTEEERYDWNEFFNHKYVKESMEVTKNVSRNYE